MVKLTVYASARDFDLANYMNVTKRVEIGREDYYTNTDKRGATLYAYDFAGRHHYDNVHWSPLYLGHAAAPDGKITGTIGGKPVAEWLAGKDLADYTPETLANRIFVGADHLRGNIGDDVLDGHAGADTLMGREGDDTLIGGVGDDILIGGFGNDTLIGGFGADHFVVRARYDLIGGGETVTDFSHAQGDVIDLTRFDADGQTEGQQPIAFIGEAAFGATGTAEVRVEATSESVNTLQFDTNGDGTLDVVLTVNTATLLDATDVLTTTPDTARLLVAAFGADSVAALPVHGAHVQHVELAVGHLA